MSSIEGCICVRPKVVFHQRLSFTKSPLPSNTISCQRLSLIIGCLSSIVIFPQRSSSKKVFFHQWPSFIKGGLPSKVVFHQMSCSIKRREMNLICAITEMSLLFRQALKKNEIFHCGMGRPIAHFHLSQKKAIFSPDHKKVAHL